MTSAAIVAVPHDQHGWTGTLVHEVDGAPDKLGTALHGLGCHAGPAFAVECAGSGTIPDPQGTGSAPKGRQVKPGDRTTAQWLYIIGPSSLTIARAISPGAWQTVMTMPWDASHTPRLKQLMQ